MKPYMDGKGRELPSAYDYIEFTRSLFVNWSEKPPLVPKDAKDTLTFADCSSACVSLSLSLFVLYNNQCYFMM